MIYDRILLFNVALYCSYNFISFLLWFNINFFRRNQTDQFVTICVYCYSALLFTAPTNLFLFSRLQDSTAPLCLQVYFGCCFLRDLNGLLSTLYRDYGFSTLSLSFETISNIKLHSQKWESLLVGDGGASDTFWVCKTLSGVPLGTVVRCIYINLMMKNLTR